MKKITQLSLFILALTFVLSSCTMQKRIYLSGYNIEWKKGIQKSDKQSLVEKKTNDAVKTTSENNVEPASTLDQTQTSIAANPQVNQDNLIASTDNSIFTLTSPKIILNKISKNSIAGKSQTTNENKKIVKAKKQQSQKKRKWW